MSRLNEQDFNYKVVLPLTNESQLVFEKDFVL